MKKIPLTRGMVALVDDNDFEWLSQWKWYAVFSKGTYYAVRSHRNANGKRTSIKMHRQILDITDSSIQVDHKNLKSLDNQRDNLRACTAVENCRNRSVRIGTSQFKGVCWKKKHNQWVVRIRVNGRLIHLGYFKNEIEAARVYDSMAIKLFGEFAATNQSMGLL